MLAFVCIARSIFAIIALFILTLFQVLETNIVKLPIQSWKNRKIHELNLLLIKTTVRITDKLVKVYE
jgi:hypothetical protein